MRKWIVGLLLLVAGMSIARIRYVPQEIPTISLAVTIATPFDTVLIANGVYTDTLSFSIPLTIASNYILTNDSSDIANTVWQIEHPRYAIYYRQGILRLIGITFQAIGLAVPSRGVVHADTSSLSIENCIFSGEFHTTITENATITCLSGDFVNLSDIRVINDLSSTFMVVVQSLRWFEMRRCFISGGAQSTRLVYATCDSVLVTDCFIENRKQVFILGAMHKFTIDNNRFTGVGPDGFRFLVSNAVMQSTVTNCFFSGTEYADEISVILSIPCPQEGQTPPLIENCVFQQFRYRSGSPGLAQIISSPTGNPIRIRKCIFRDNEISTSSMLIINAIGTIDSCQFIRNIVHHELWEGVPVDRDPRFEACDFIGNSNPILIGTADSVIANNCYWGDPSGPRYSGNPNGLGQSLSPIINPSNWRTTPVFPSNAIGDRGQSNSIHEYAFLRTYPNPANSSVTISYSLPHSEKNTRIELFDPLGRRVSVLYDGFLTAGEHHFQWHPERVSSGTYYVRATIPNNISPATTAIQLVK